MQCPDCKQLLHDGPCEPDDSDFEFYADLAKDRSMAFDYLHKLLAASSPTHRTEAQKAEIRYVRNICDIAKQV